MIVMQKRANKEFEKLSEVLNPSNLVTNEPCRVTKRLNSLEE